ncbi:hypothetical protein [Amycolatopsis saalfeldensis]|uniref:hypothetical protein n=1 Tax=Amycolatopsis saalfeldensis TaxID=394193 RepID=UPI001FE97E52|nr:hypothetical protein [Amycolatopsis saalfeldensis]
MITAAASSVTVTTHDASAVASCELVASFMQTLVVPLIPAFPQLLGASTTKTHGTGQHRQSSCFVIDPT